MIEISGYQLIEVIHEGVATIIYRSTRLLDQNSVIIKILTTDNPTIAEISSIKQEYLIAENLEIEGIVKPLSLETYQNRLALVLEDFGGISLKQLLDREPLDLTTFLNYAIQLTEALGHLHAHQIIHKDIKPKSV
jgi:serine/threonine protein kinase